MPTLLRTVRSVLLSVLILLLGHGLQLTLLPLHAQQIGWSNDLIGLTGSAYYLGFALGCVYVARFIVKVGHIRTFIVSVSVAAISILSVTLVANFEFWLLARLANGASMAALYTVVESWLNERSENHQRGSLLALYSAICLGAMAAGQIFIELDGSGLAPLFSLAVMMLMAAILPIGLTTQLQPAAPVNLQFDLRQVNRASQVGWVAAALAGIVVGLLWSMGAVYAVSTAGALEAGSRFILCVLLGGFLLQLPAGRLSDRMDRRWILLLLGLCGLAGSLLALYAPFAATTNLYIAGFLCGAGAMPIYSIAIAHANDNAQGHFLQIASGMLVIHAIGCIAGPMLYALLAGIGGLDVFMLTIALAFALCVLWTAIRLASHRVERRYFEPYQPLPKTSTEAAALDPRVDDDVEGALLKND